MGTGALQHVPLAKLFEAEATLCSGDFQECSAILDEAAKIIAATSQRFYQPELYRLRGEVFSALRQNAEAEEQYRLAIELAITQASRSWQLRASTSLARLWRGDEKRGEAAALLVPLYDWFSEGFETPDLLEAKALIEELE